MIFSYPYVSNANFEIMKNLFLATALVLSLSANADSTIGKSDITVLEYQEKEYKKVETTQVPADILKNASTRYSGYALNEAFASEDGEYRLILTKDGKIVKAYYKSTGEFIKEEAK
jgi:hypothetical protein